MTAEPGVEGGPGDGEAREQLLRGKRAHLQALSPSRYPHLVASADALTACGDVDRYYDRGLDLLAAGVRQLR